MSARPLGQKRFGAWSNAFGAVLCLSPLSLSFFGRGGGGSGGPGASVDWWSTINRRLCGDAFASLRPSTAGGAHGMALSQCSVPPPLASAPSCALLRPLAPSCALLRPPSCALLHPRCVCTAKSLTYIHAQRSAPHWQGYVVCVWGGPLVACAPSQGRACCGMCPLSGGGMLWHVPPPLAGGGVTAHLFPAAHWASLQGPRT